MAVSGDYHIESRFLIGADGAASVVRTSLGISLTGPADIGAAVSMTFTADLTDFVREPPPGCCIGYSLPRSGESCSPTSPTGSGPTSCGYLPGGWT